MTIPPRSWSLPSPVLFTASDPHAASGKAGVASILVIDETGVQPVWTASLGGNGKVYQAEGDSGPALAAIKKDGPLPGWSRAIVTTLGIDPAPFLKAGVTSCMVECYAQAGDEPYGDLHRMTWQAKHDGWPHVVPILGVYDNVDLAHYFPINGGAVNFTHGHWRGGPLGIYLAEGMGDTASWPTLAAL